MPISKKGIQITTLKEWESLAPPKSEKHWKDGRSAKESARAWLEGKGIQLPSEVISALTSHPAFGEVKKWNAKPEVRLRFDKLAGETRNTDLVIFAQDSHGPFLIAVEAKADETFSETLADTLSAAVERFLKNARSRGVARVEQLANALLGPRKDGDPPLNKIRYQLLTACAGAICEADQRGYERALLLIHEFVTDSTTDANHLRNAADLNAFASRLSHGKISKIPAEAIVGPFNAGTPLFNTKVRLFIGKVSRNLRTTRTTIGNSGVSKGRTRC